MTLSWHCSNTSGVSLILASTKSRHSNLAVLSYHSGVDRLGVCCFSAVSTASSVGSSRRCRPLGHCSLCVSGLFYAHTTQRQAAEIADECEPEPWNKPEPSQESATAAAEAEAVVGSALAKFSAAKAAGEKPPHARPKQAPSSSMSTLSQVEPVVEVYVFVTVQLYATAVSTANEISFPCVTNWIGRWRCRPPVLHSCFY